MRGRRKNGKIGGQGGRWEDKEKDGRMEDMGEWEDKEEDGRMENKEEWEDGGQEGMGEWEDKKEEWEENKLWA